MPIPWHHIQSPGKLSFTATGSTTARSLADRAGDVVNVKDFGAKGDGVTDDTAAIQAAIDAAYAQGGGVVRLKGKHVVSTPGLVLKYAVTLFSEAGQAERTAHTNSTAATLLATGATPFDVVTVGTSGNATSAMQAGIKGVAIFNSPGNGIVVHSHGVTIEGCSVVDAKQAGIILNSGTTNVLNTHVIRPGRQGIVVNHGDNRIGAGTEVQQANNSGAGEAAGTYDAVYVASGVGGIQIYNVRVGDDYYRSRDGIRLDGAWDVQITNSDFQNCTVAGIRVRGGHMNSITNTAVWSSSADANKAGIVLESDDSANPARRVAIVGNTLNGVVTAGLGGISVGTGSTDIAITGNTIWGTWLGAYAIVGDMSGVNKMVVPLYWPNGSTSGVKIADSGGTVRDILALDSGNALKLGGTGVTGSIYFNNDTFATGRMRYYQPGSSAGTPGNATLNTAAGRSAVASGATSVTITNSLVTATSDVFAVLQTSDATAVLKNVVPASGSFTLNLTAAATADTTFAWFVTGG